MLDPETVEILNEITKDYRDKKLQTRNASELKADELAMIKKVADNWSRVEEVVKAYESWQGFFRVGKYIFWFIIGLFMLLTYFKDFLGEVLKRWAG
jgi:hypothetical protein